MLKRNLHILAFTLFHIGFGVIILGLMYNISDAVPYPDPRPQDIMQMIENQQRAEFIIMSGAFFTALSLIFLLVACLVKEKIAST